MSEPHTSKQHDDGAFDKLVTVLQTSAYTAGASGGCVGREAMIEAGKAIRECYARLLERHSVEPTCVHPWANIGVSGDGHAFCSACLTNLVKDPPWVTSEPPEPALSYSQACNLLATYHIAATDRECCGDSMQPAYLDALHDCLEAMGHPTTVTKSASTPEEMAQFDRYIAEVSERRIAEAAHETGASR